MAEQDAWSAKLAEFERTVETHFRRNPVDEGNAHIEEAANTHNDWVSQVKAASEERARALALQARAVRELDERIEGMDRRLKDPHATATQMELLTLPRAYEARPSAFSALLGRSTTAKPSAGYR